LIFKKRNQARSITELGSIEKLLKIEEKGKGGKAKKGGKKGESFLGESYYPSSKITEITEIPGTMT